LRTTITVACAVIGPALIGLSFLVPSAAAYRAYLLYAGLAVLALGLLLAAVRTLRRGSRREPTASDLTRDASTADVGILEPTAPSAPARAQVDLRVGGNGASEPWARWYYVAATTTDHVRAAKARVSVAVRGAEVGAEHWQWDGGARAVDLGQTGARIPIVIGGVHERAQPVAPGWVVPYRNWYITPNGHSALGPFLAPFIAGFRHVFDVSVTWTEAGSAQTASASFELRFWREPTSEPRFIKIGDRPSYHDQIGGLAELRDKGTALRKEGMLLPAGGLNSWLGRVDSWTSETRAVIAEVSTADSDYFFALKNFQAPLFEGVRMHDERHRQALRELHERLIRLQFFMRPAGN
jgi:hypothetical protein